MMKASLRVAVAALVGAGAVSTGLAEMAGGRASLLVAGPGGAVSATENNPPGLGQLVHTAVAGRLAVGSEVAVFGTRQADGSIIASSIQSRGLYVPGASPIFLSGTVQSAQPAVGRVVVNGITVDLTSIMSYGVISPLVGSKLTV